MFGCENLKETSVHQEHATSPATGGMGVSKSWRVWLLHAASKLPQSEAMAPVTMLHASNVQWATGLEARQGGLVYSCDGHSLQFFN